MATITWQQPSTEVLANVAQNAARLQQQIAVISKETATAKTDKTDNYFFLSTSNGSVIRLRNDKKQLLELNLSFNYGLTYPIPSMRDGSPNVDLINLIADISKNTTKLDTSLGLDWLVVAFRVYNTVIMRRVDAVTAETIKANVSDWVTAIKSLSDVSNAIVITDWLINKSYVRNAMNASEKTTLDNLITELKNRLQLQQQPTQQPQTVKAK